MFLSFQTALSLSVIYFLRCGVTTGENAGTCIRHSYQPGDAVRLDISPGAIIVGMKLLYRTCIYIMYDIKYSHMTNHNITSLQLFEK